MGRARSRPAVTLGDRERRFRRSPGQRLRHLELTARQPTRCRPGGSRERLLDPDDRRGARARGALGRVDRREARLHGPGALIAAGDRLGGSACARTAALGVGAERRARSRAGDRRDRTARADRARPGGDRAGRARGVAPRAARRRRRACRSPTTRHACGCGAPARSRRARAALVGTVEHEVSTAAAYRAPAGREPTPDRAAGCALAGRAGRHERWTSRPSCAGSSRR